LEREAFGRSALLSSFQIAVEETGRADMRAAYDDCSAIQYQRSQEVEIEKRETSKQARN